MVTDRDDFLAWVHAELTDAEIAMHQGDAAPRRAVWSQNEPVSVLGARINAFGQHELDALFEQLAAVFSGCTAYAIEVLEAEVLGDTAYTVAFEHISATVDGVAHTYVLRATQVYRREAGAWKVAHRHGSAPPE